MSTVFNNVSIHIQRLFKEKLKWDRGFLTPSRLEQYCEHIQANGEPSGLIWGFIHGSHQKVCRPTPETCDQSLLYSGYKHAYTTVFQSISTPDGLLIHFKGPYEGRVSDWGILKHSGLQENLKNYSHNTAGSRLWIYGDAGYGLEKGILSSYRSHHSTGQHTESEEIFNASMARQRIVVEWCFGKLVTLFPLIDYFKKLKVGLSQVGSWIFTAVLLTNAHTCYYGSETTAYFDCPPPSIQEYLITPTDNRNADSDMPDSDTETATSSY